MLSSVKWWCGHYMLLAAGLLQASLTACHHPRNEQLLRAVGDQGITVSCMVGRLSIARSRVVLKLIET
jgi:hypothetical protein